MNTCFDQSGDDWGDFLRNAGFAGVAEHQSPPPPFISGLHSSGLDWQGGGTWARGKSNFSSYEIAESPGNRFYIVCRVNGELDRAAMLESFASLGEAQAACNEHHASGLWSGKEPLPHAPVIAPRAWEHGSSANAHFSASNGTFYWIKQLSNGCVVRARSPVEIDYVFFECDLEAAKWAAESHIATGKWPALPLNPPLYKK